MATNSLVTGLKVFLPVMFCVMLATLIYTIITDGLPEPDRRDVFTPWFATTILDFYINIVPIAVWIVYKETTWFGSILWAILLIVFGSLTTCVYLFMQLLKLTPQEASEDPMYFLLLRDSFKDGAGPRDKKSLVVTARFVFGALGCVMLGALVYTCLTDGSPFRMELLYPWMVVLLVSFYINVAVLSVSVSLAPISFSTKLYEAILDTGVWVVYKESSWIIGILWVALLLSLGSFGTSVVIVVQLFRLSPLDPLYLVLVKNSNRKFEHERINRFEKCQGANLYLKNLDDSVDNEKLKVKEMFSEFGNVTSSKLSEMVWEDDRKETTLHSAKKINKYTYRFLIKLSSSTLTGSNACPGRRYMNGAGNGRNGMDLSVSQGTLPPPVMHLPIDASSNITRKLPYFHSLSLLFS
ncbi:hypothetical protein YC2023_058622 [Brassica napus]